jgi:NADPH-dependent glutamate synthase beta subunit-like oxidoreductase
VEGRTHKPVHDEARCAACSICVSLCPSVSFPEYRLDRGTVRAVVHARRALVPVSNDVRPCRAACPLHQAVPIYNGKVARGDAAGALAVIRATNPLPAVCGTVCNRSCERACVRARVDEAVQIRSIKRFAVEELLRADKHVPAGAKAPGAAARSVAVVGSGPAGLAAAHELAAAGIRVAVYDEQPRIGGMLACAVPTFVLPRELLAADIAVLEALGVAFYVGVRIGRDVNLETLRRDHDAVLLAVGAWRGKPLGTPGERWLEEVLDHVEFARRTAIEGPKPRSGPAIVVGGTTAAFQCARIAVRLGCSPVTVAFARSFDELPADAEAVADAREEGVEVLDLVRPIEVRAESGRLSGVRLARMRREEPDAWGYRALAEAAEAKPLDLPAATLIVAGDRVPDLRLLGGMPGVARSPLGFLSVDRATGMTSIPGLFAAGDVVTGPKGVVEAVAAGRKVAASIREWVVAHPRPVVVPPPKYAAPVEKAKAPAVQVEPATARPKPAAKVKAPAAKAKRTKAPAAKAAPKGKAKGKGQR